MSRVGTRNQIRARLEQWRSAHGQLEKLHLNQARRMSTEQAIACFDELFESALERSPKKMHSGLVEQQAWFKKAMPK